MNKLRKERKRRISKLKEENYWRKKCSILSKKIDWESLKKWTEDIKRENGVTEGIACLQCRTMAMEDASGELFCKCFSNYHELVYELDILGLENELQ